MRSSNPARVVRGSETDRGAVGCGPRHICIERKVCVWLPEIYGTYTTTTTRSILADKPTYLEMMATMFLLCWWLSLATAAPLAADGELAAAAPLATDGGSAAAAPLATDGGTDMERALSGSEGGQTAVRTALGGKRVNAFTEQFGGEEDGAPMSRAVQRKTHHTVSSGVLGALAPPRFLNMLYTMSSGSEDETNSGTDEDGDGRTPEQKVEHFLGPFVKARRVCPIATTPAPLEVPANGGTAPTADKHRRRMRATVGSHFPKLQKDPNLQDQLRDQYADNHLKVFEELGPRRSPRALAVLVWPEGGHGGRDWPAQVGHTAMLLPDVVSCRMLHDARDELRIIDVYQLTAWRKLKARRSPRSCGRARPLSTPSQPLRPLLPCRPIAVPPGSEGL